MRAKQKVYNFHRQTTNEILNVTLINYQSGQPPTMQVAFFKLAMSRAHLWRYQMQAEPETNNFHRQMSAECS